MRYVHVLRYLEEDRFEAFSSLAKALDFFYKDENLKSQKWDETYKRLEVK